MNRFINCGGNFFDRGRIVTADYPAVSTADSKIYYESHHKKPSRSKTPLEGIVCLECGHVEFFMDLEHLKRRIRK